MIWSGSLDLTCFWSMIIVIHGFYIPFLASYQPVLYHLFVLDSKGFQEWFFCTQRWLLRVPRWKPSDDSTYYPAYEQLFDKENQQRFEIFSLLVSFLAKSWWNILPLTVSHTPFSLIGPLRLQLFRIRSDYYLFLYARFCTRNLFLTRYNMPFMGMSQSQSAFY